MNKKILQRLVEFQNPTYKQFLDEENVLAILQSQDKYPRFITHERLNQGQLEVVNKWQTIFYEDFKDSLNIMNQLILVRNANNKSNCSFSYKYKQGCYMLKNEIWDSIDFGENNSFFQRIQWGIRKIYYNF